MTVAPESTFTPDPKSTSSSVAVDEIATNTECKLKLKELRNQTVIYGIIVAPLGTAIVAFLLNNVVVGGSSCGF